MNKECYKASIRLLSKQDFSKFKLKQKLQRKFDIEDIEEVIIELEKQRFLNELEFTKGRIRHLLKRRKSPFYILHKTKIEGLDISISLINELQSELGLKNDQVVEQILLKKLKMIKKPIWDQGIFKVKEKLYSYLMSQGYNGLDYTDLITKLVNEFQTENRSSTHEQIDI